MRSSLLLAAVASASALSGPIITSELQPAKKPFVLMEASAKSQARADIFVPGVVRVMTFLQASMESPAHYAPASVSDYKTLLDNCQVAVSNFYPSSLCSDLAAVHKDSYQGKDLFSSPNLSLIAKDMSAYLETQDQATSKVAADVKRWVDSLQQRVKSVGGTLFHQDGVSHSGVAMQLGMLCAQLPESHANPGVCPKFVAAYNSMFQNEDIFSPEGGANSAFVSTLVSIVVLDRKESRPAVPAEVATTTHHQKQAGGHSKGGDFRFVEKKPAMYGGFEKGEQRAFGYQKVKYRKPYPGSHPPSSYEEYRSVWKAEREAENQLVETPKTKGFHTTELHPTAEVDKQGKSTIPDEAVVATEGGLDVPLSFRLGYPAIANRALDLNVFKTQVREDCAFALNSTVERFAVASVEPSFNNRYVNVVLRIYPIMYNNPPTAGSLLMSMKRQILNEVSPLRLGIATRHLFVPGDTSAKAFRATYVRPISDNGAGSNSGKLVATFTVSLSLFLFTVFA